MKRAWVSIQRTYSVIKHIGEILNGMLISHRILYVYLPWFEYRFSWAQKKKLPSNEHRTHMWLKAFTAHTNAHQINMEMSFILNTYLPYLIQLTIDPEPLNFD